MAINLSGINLGGGSSTSAPSAECNLRIVPVEALPDLNIAKRGVIYIVPASKPTSDNKYDEYIVIDTDNGPAWELFGRNITIDLSGYVTKSDIESLVSKQEVLESAGKMQGQLTALDLKVSDLAAAVGAANEELNAI